MLSKATFGDTDERRGSVARKGGVGFVEFLDALSIVPDLFCDTLIGGSSWVHKPSTNATNARTDEIHRLLFDKHPMSSDRISVSQGDSLAEQLSGVMKELRDPGLSEPRRRRLQADLSVAMRRFINPQSREAKLLEDLRGEKIRKREAKRREGRISGIESKELEALYDSESRSQEVQRTLEKFRKEFKSLDKEQKIFSKGQKVRRDLLNAWSAVTRFNMRHRVLVISSVTLALLLCTIVPFVVQRKRDHH